MLARVGFDPARVHPKIRDFYERTHAFRLDTWATTYFPARLALWALVTTISRRVEQLNFPIDGLETSHGMTSEIALMRDAAGALRYTGWLRKLQKTGNVIYSGFYMTVKPPLVDGACVKVVFPMPNGNATVSCAPTTRASRACGSSRSAARSATPASTACSARGTALRVWRITTLHERFRLYVDGEETVRCEHDVSFLGLRVLTLHYRIANA